MLAASAFPMKLANFYTFYATRLLRKCQRAAGDLIQGASTKTVLDSEHPSPTDGQCTLFGSDLIADLVDPRPWALGRSVVRLV